MGKYIGKSVAFEFAIAAATAIPSSLTFAPLGAMRDKSIGIKWDTTDFTADDSPGATKEQGATFKTVDISGSGVSRGPERPNQDALEAFINTPTAVTGYQPCVWLRLTHPSGKIYVGYFLCSEFSTDAPYADAITWSLTATSNGALTITPA
jgi:predicted secreted protein